MRGSPSTLPGTSPGGKRSPGTSPRPSSAPGWSARSAARPLPADAAGAAYLREACEGRVAESGASRGGDPRGGLVVHMPVPVRQAKRVVGVLVAALRLRVIHDWLEPINIGLGGII